MNPCHAILWAATLAQPPSKVPGLVVDHTPAHARQYIGSPSLAVLPSGVYVASHDFFGPGSTKDATRVFASGDRGQTWVRRADIQGQWWSSLFVHRGELYLMGTSKEYGHCVIRRSGDGGTTWTEPKDAASGLLLSDARYHCAPVPVVVHGGRIWRAMEDAMGPGPWGEHFRAFVMSAPADADLLQASSWTCTNRLGRDPQWLGSSFGGWLEGNVTVTPTGAIANVLRVHQPGYPEKAAVLAISADGRRVEFDAATGFIDFPGGGKKFSIRYDAATRAWWTLTNFVPKEQEGPRPDRRRNTLALARSADLRAWDVTRVLLQHPDVSRHGFQYADWQFDGDDLIAVVRTAFDEPDGTQAHNAHDANYMTFHRVPRFRE